MRISKIVSSIMSSPIFRVALVAAIYRGASSISSLILKQWARMKRATFCTKPMKNSECTVAAAEFNSKIIGAWKFINFIRLIPSVNSRVDEKFKTLAFSAVLILRTINCVKIDIFSAGRKFFGNFCYKFSYNFYYNSPILLWNHFRLHDYHFIYENFLRRKTWMLCFKLNQYSWHFKV